MYNNLVDKAKEIAYQAHKGQTDKAGKPYTEHLEFVAAHVEGEREKCVAYLHDVLEDTDYAPEKIKEIFGQEIFDAVCAMTHRKDEDYFDYVRRAAQNPIAIKVKEADLKNNMMLERLPKVTEKELERIEKYKKAYEILKNKI